MNRRPSDEKLGDMLKTPHFGHSNQLPAADPIAPTPMVLTLAQIKPYDRNPRRERNPLYDEIKESIQAQGGLNNPITVTKRPGEERYMVESGGNTRLQVLIELYEETHNESFNQINVLYRPWLSETHVLTAHLIENEKRGDMLFIDKAMAVRELKTMFESETQSALSLRQLGQRLKDVGLSVDTAVLSRMEYCVDVLLPLIPEALRAGLGRPQIERIRRIEKAFQQYWTEIAKQDESLFSELFNDCLAENNRPEWDNDALRDTLEERFVDFLQVPTRALRLDIDALLRGKNNESPVVEPEPINTTPPATVPSLNELEKKTNRPENVEASTPNQTSPDVSPTYEDDETGSQTEVEPTEENDLGSEQTYSSIGTLRRQIFETALQLAKQHQLESCVHYSSDWGLGFLVDIPDQPLVGNTHDIDSEQRWQQLIRQWVWWMLYICSEETARPERITNIPETLSIRRLCLEGNQEELLRILGQPAWLSLGYQLLADPLFPEDDYQDLINLMRQCRFLRQSIDGDDDPLWLEKYDYETS